MKFDFHSYGDKHIMICDTKEQAETFCAHLDSIGERWASGDSYADHSGFNQVYGTYYRFQFGTRGSLEEGVEGRLRFGDIPLFFEDFEWDEYNTPQTKITFEEMFNGTNKI